MVLFESENELKEALDKHDELLCQCARGNLPFWDFNERYDNFYWAYALDGHESDTEEKALLKKHHERIEPHRIVQEEILSLVCSDEDAKKEQYRMAGRISSKEAILRIAEIVTTYLKTAQSNLQRTRLEVWRSYPESSCRPAVEAVVMLKITIGIVSVVAVLVVLQAFTPLIQWDGFASRQIIVIAQASDGSPIPGALITFRDHWYDFLPSIPLAPLTEEERKNWQEEQQNWRSQHSVSGHTEADGSFTFKGRFPAGGKRILFWDHGRFRLAGIISIQAEGYQTLESPLSKLVRQNRIPVWKHRRKPITVLCSLKKKELPNNRLNRIFQNACVSRKLIAKALLPNTNLLMALKTAKLRPGDVIWAVSG